ncbi:hypothetical protein [Pseudoflavonifractor hominis]|uniref:Lipoprotein n=1 Tax=Pseudoflavonifractor hominis TaxID=2763059 RepID=A0ABR7HX47_9FIRM|nr:hypothetical protein [Pseudoflavonifractor hominis]MBC5732089.1 hypothetical protein [Pseudoflavonifractor hominis]
MMKKYLFLPTLAIAILMSGCQSTASTKPENTPIQTGNIENSLTSEMPVATPTEEPIETKREDADFRNAKWGENRDTVKKYETEITLIESDEKLAGETVVGGYDSYAAYLFDDDKLYEGFYTFPLKFSNAGQYIPVYNDLKEMLTKKYGEPYEDEIIPLTEQSLIDSAGPADALHFGYVVYRAQWETKTTDIMIGMMAENFDESLLISYTDKNYEEDINDTGL